MSVSLITAGILSCFLTNLLEIEGIWDLLIGHSTQTLEKPTRLKQMLHCSWMGLGLTTMECSAHTVATQYIHDTERMG